MKHKPNNKHVAKNTRSRKTSSSPFEKFIDTRPKRVRTPKADDTRKPYNDTYKTDEPQAERRTHSRPPLTQHPEHEQRRAHTNRSRPPYNQTSKDGDHRNERPAYSPRYAEGQNAPQKNKRYTKSKPSFENTPQHDTTPTDSRLNKFVANSGICSRRKADEYIAQGMVSVNDQVVIEMGYRVQPTDVVRFKGKIINPEVRKVYLLLNKPKNFISTASDEKGRKTILDIVKNACNERLYPVGRLDRDTTGLILLTNDGELATKLSHPSSQVRKVYHVTLDKKVHPDDIKAIAKGVTLEDGVAIVDGVDYMEGYPNNEVGVILHMGRNRMIRRIFEHLGYQVEKLDRIVYASLTKKDLPRGHWRHLTDMEVINLRHFTK